jgi:prepilin-type N-terminal cleavage/methylation domain-containing protein
MSTAPHVFVRGRWRFGTSANAITRPRALCRGFTAIELVSVVAVTLVMAAVAASAYLTYPARREVSKTLLTVVPIQILVADSFERSGVPPASEHAIPGLQSVVPQYAPIEEVAVKHGRIEILFGRGAAASLRGKVLHLTPFETAEGHVTWQCGNGAAEVGLYPLGFVGGTSRAVELVTTVQPRYLPGECR